MRCGFILRPDTKKPEVSFYQAKAAFSIMIFKSSETHFSDYAED